MARRLRSGYTTGACAAAAAKGATQSLLAGKAMERVVIPFPDASRVEFELCRCIVAGQEALASVVKDAGDDPDVTNGAEIVATVRRLTAERRNENCITGEDDKRLLICGGQGVGTVTKPGLDVPVGEPAINPVPRRMIQEAVAEVLDQANITDRFEIVISVPAGEELATKTLNRRLGIVGGLSILGTTGIVRPVSATAWTATIEASMTVARAAGLDEVVLSTGRTSELGAQQLLDLPEEAYAMMGDYLEFSLRAAAQHGFKKIHLAGMWAKVMKAAMGIPQTHMRHGALEAADAVHFLDSLGVEPGVLIHLAEVNTAREIYTRLTGMDRQDIIAAVCGAAKEFAEQTSGLPVSVYLVNAKCKVLANV